ncbi:IS66 family insertion sequence element accessory protein TnpB [Phocaeicola abscessus]|uniref:IS66 family insertion sequence element accessory protein TnpB n=1 Tax=Phocaeicola abscessus TaxID=555313 RepID=UPI00056C4F16|nr:IS66 family insertion sequence element accessory protein TnpB [Phocaeicola abscessus]
MFSLTSSIRYWVCRRTVYMRNGINGLSIIIQGEFKQDPTSGDAFVFFSKDCSSVKILRWDGDGYIIYHKRLAKGTFEQSRPTSDGSVKYELQWERFCLIMQGVSLKKIRFRKRFRLPSNSDLQ